MSCTLVSVGRKGISVKIPGTADPVALFPSHDLNDGSHGFQPAYFPVRLGYSTTLHKIQGATLQHITIWLDVPWVRASAYVAISRVQQDKDWRFVGQLDYRHFLPEQIA